MKCTCCCPGTGQPAHPPRSPTKRLSRRISSSANRQLKSSPVAAAALTDHLHFATLKATRSLTLLDLTALLQEDVTSFESLDMAIHLLFLAPSHSYPITRAI